MQRKLIRPAILAALQASPALTGLPVLLDDAPPGEPDTDQEAALKTTGAVAAITQILRTKPLAVVEGGEIPCEVEIGIHLRLNPERNAMQAQPRNIDDLIEGVIAALLNMKQSPTAKLVVKTTEELTRFIPEDSGNITHAIYFTARTWVRAN